MISFIGSCIKYSFFAVIVLVSAHVITFKNITVSDYVLSAVNWTKSEGRISAESISSYSSSALRNVKQDADLVTERDQAELKEIIQKRTARRK